jgi:endonuclease YncB( thermonuclease family)
MPMLTLSGTYRIVGAQPDGDSIRFYPDDPSQWDLVPGPTKVQRNATGGAQLRLDAIDALETHYTTSGLGTLHQQPALGDAAAARLLALLGFTSVTRNADQTVTAAEPAQVPGYLFTRTADEYGRCVSLIGAGAAPGTSGTMVHVGVEALRKTANYALLADGLTYPTYYRLLYADLRDDLTAAVAKARAAQTGVWAQDRSQAGLDLAALATLTDGPPILPKLFRRLADFIALGHGDVSLTGFEAYLEQRDDKLYIISTGQYTGFDTVVVVTGQEVHMTRPPEDLIFQEG